MADPSGWYGRERWDAGLQIHVKAWHQAHRFQKPIGIMEDPEFHCAICGLGESKHPILQSQRDEIEAWLKSRREAKA